MDSCLGAIIAEGQAELQTGPFGTMLKAEEYSSEGAPVISVGEVREGYLEIGSKTPRVSDETIARLPRFLLKQNDIVFGRKGSTHRNALIKEGEEGYFLGSDGIRLRVKSDCLCPKYLSYQLRSAKAVSWLKANSEGTTMPSLNQDILSRFPITLLPFAEQKAIAHILGTLDDKIELNRKTHETLEAMAKALFNSWFLDFDPVRAKAEGRPTGLPAEISNLFPDSFEDSELGEIPSGWNVQSAGKQYDISIGKTPPRRESQWFSTSKVDMPWLSIRDLGEVGVYADRTSESLTREAVEKFNVKIVPPDTTVLSFKLTIGRVAITGSEMLTNEAIAHFSPLTKGAGSEYTYCLLSQYDYHSLGSTSSIATAVNSQILRDMPLVVPPESIARAFCDTAAPIFSSIKCGQQETHCLSDFRDTLLPKLISGEIRIPDAEKLLEEVGV
jgi:type I restriction enzyme S subunit